MLNGFAVVFISGLILGKIAKTLKLPPLTGMIFSGILLGPHAFGLISSELMNISADLRQLALVIILTRAGLTLEINDLKKIGRPAVMMCFVPACFEIAGTILIAPLIFGISHIEAAVLGSVLAAVSPAVVVPRMIKIIEEGYGRERKIPQLVLAGAAADDVFVIVMFTSFAALCAGGSFVFSSIAQVPVSIITGIVVGALGGYIVTKWFEKTEIKSAIKVVILLSISFVFLYIQDNISAFSGLIAIMSMGMAITHFNKDEAKLLSSKYNELWTGAEIMLFVLVGAEVEIAYALSAGALAIAMVVAALVFRMAGVFCCTVKTNLNKKERLFCMISYTPKATVQAAIGAVPLSMGLACGNLVLTAAVLAILITAPVGAAVIDSTYKKLLK
ncbi:MAG: cation:proton antiporter [Firmicutes bacterium]|nr:cation:proton antiporter [Bacillota bacterium]